MLRAGLPTPSAQYRVFDGDGFVARVDFAWPELRLALEYDGDAIGWDQIANARSFLALCHGMRG